ncbi:cation-translocating P-type ATPase [Nitrosomonas sp. Nm166]|uniref:cation-translocating P-type ATPase n=1 Tax=Nitrosomonas sp. Nm166 TaxID=1881054 RepID=UPI0008E86F16|nr:cation-translocating P-type ATPase [Nitrosomonas sp. Nm166]SFE17639.1 Ca2+-transporting ATPase [Nitrosomonas sp. Nm166]
MSSWHVKTAETVFTDLKSDSSGLSSIEAKARLQTYGENRLQEGKPVAAWETLVEQFKNLMVGILLLAAVVSAYLGIKTGDGVLDAVIIFAIVILNALFGFVQEFKAEKAMEALRKLTAPHARVVRDRRLTTISSIELVPGDIILLETGDSVPADCRLLSLVQLQVDESALTGESVPVKKTLDVFKNETALAERKNMLFTGTVISRGRATACVVETGQKTELGKIATLVTETEVEKTPLQKELDSVGKFLVITIGVIIAITFVVGWFRLNTLSEKLLVPIALAVAAIPEGLAAAITVALAFGSVAMTKRNAIARKLSVVENLGSVNVICTDKTGTLTANQMTVEAVYVNDTLLEVTGKGYAPEGQILDGKSASYDINNPTLQMLLQAGALCNDAKLTKNNNWDMFGDPTEGCLLTLAGKAELTKEAMEKQMPRVDEIQFDSERKMMTTVHQTEEERLLFTKGALESVLAKCTRIMMDGKIQPLTGKQIDAIHAQQNQLADQAYRMLAIAYRPVTTKDSEKTYESNLIFLGVVAMVDPIRPEVYEAVDICHQAGIRVVMITGDHLKTAVAIAKKLNIHTEKALEGVQLDSMSPEELQRTIQTVNVYARASPETKIRIVTTLQADGQVTAMTGDGVNDAPAIKKAEVGIAMGLRGTDVAKQSSSLVLQDDNFATIVAAIREGRRIYNNIRKFLLFLLGCNLGEVIAISGGLLILGNPILLPIQILWMNLVTDGAPALALSVQPEDKAIMKKKPRDSKERVIAPWMRKNMIFVGVFQGILTLLTYYIAVNYFALGEVESATLAFSMLVLLELFYALSAKSEIDSIFTIKKGEGWLYTIVFGSVLAQLAIIYIDSLRVIFKTTFLPPEYLFVVLVLSLSYVGTEEVRKIFRRRQLKKGELSD